MIYSEQPKDFVSEIEVVSCSVERDGKILLLHRHNHKPQGGKWGAPAGKVDLSDNSSLDAMIRELREETGIKAKSEDLIFHKTFSVSYPEKNFLYHYYQLKIDNNTSIIIKEDEHQGHVWVTPEEALEMPLIMDEDYCIKYIYQIK